MRRDGEGATDGVTGSWAFQRSDDARLSHRVWSPGPAKLLRARLPARIIHP
jgi:hypothetical protein